MGLFKTRNIDPCFLCRADRGANSWTQFDIENAGWLNTVWTALGWLNTFPHRHYLFRLLGVSILSVAPDLMH
eukprot:3124993-Karenia_brevis.AAC.1